MVLDQLVLRYGKLLYITIQNTVYQVFVNKIKFVGEWFQLDLKSTKIHDKTKPTC